MHGAVKHPVWLARSRKYEESKQKHSQMAVTPTSAHMQSAYKGMPNVLIYMYMYMHMQY